jgi:phage-related protein
MDCNAPAVAEVAPPFARDAPAVAQDARAVADEASTVAGAASAMRQEALPMAAQARFSWIPDRPHPEGRPPARRDSDSRIGNARLHQEKRHPEEEGTRRVPSLPRHTKICILRPAMKKLFWVGSTLQDLRAFPEAARRMVGHGLHLVQEGLQPDDWKPMTSVGPGAYELRIHTGLEHRIFYVAKFEEGVYVLHAFEKKTRQTAQRDIELARERYREVLRDRQRTSRPHRR